MFEFFKDVFLNYISYWTEMFLGFVNFLIGVYEKLTYENIVDVIGFFLFFGPPTFLLLCFIVWLDKKDDKKRKLT